MKFIQTPLSDLVVIEPKVFADSRGFFMEIFHAKKFLCAGIEANFVQDNHSVSEKGTLRGLHYQLPHAQGKLVRVTEGSVFDICVDIRHGSPTFGRWFGIEISAENKKELWIPPGFAHGFCVTSRKASFLYKCTDYYTPSAEHTLLWNDPELNINWPLENPILSEKDTRGLPLKNIPPESLPTYEVSGSHLIPH